MEMKEPVAIFNVEGFKMLIEALQGKKVDLSAFAGEPKENEIDSFIDGYNQFKAGEPEEAGELPHRPNRTPESQYEAVFNLLKISNGPLKMAEIRSGLKKYFGIVRDPKSYTQLMIGAMRRYPIEKTEYGTYGLKPEFMDEDIFDGGNDNE